MDPQQSQEQTQEIKPGVKTSEFWITILNNVVGLGLLVYGLVADNDTAATIGASLSGLTTSAYTLARSKAKTA